MSIQALVTEKHHPAILAVHFKFGTNARAVNANGFAVNKHRGTSLFPQEIHHFPGISRHL
jgi:hypothetical protein